MRIGLRAVVAFALATVSASACSNVVGYAGRPGHPPRSPIRGTSDRVDLLFVVDNSPGMAAKLSILAESVPRLLGELANPPCVDASGAVVSQPVAATDVCPPDAARSFKPVSSIHVGVITSSLGGLGSDACSASDPGSHSDDQAHLITRATAASATGFLSFDQPSGIAVADSLAQFTSDVTDLLQSAGESGCEFPMPLEAAYRFLVDPAPYASLAKIGADSPPRTQKQGLDVTLLSQRETFLRPDSVLGIVVLADANDCSAKVGDQSYALLNLEPSYRASSDCVLSTPFDCGTAPPFDCCHSCATAPPLASCGADPACSAGAKYTPAEDPPNLKCFHQKERYGIEGLYPVARYVNAFSQPNIVPDVADLEGPGAVPNPLFAGGRATTAVVVTTIVGVPWQLIAFDRTQPALGTQDPSMMANRGTWSAIAGDPRCYVPPTNASMEESRTPRAGVDPSFNGGDWKFPGGAALEYACTFPLDVPIENSPRCTSVAGPTCQGTVQIAGGAYPSIRELALAQGLGEQGVVGSICQTGSAPGPIDPTDRAFGYNVTMDAMVHRLGESLAAQ